MRWTLTFCSLDIGDESSGDDIEIFVVFDEHLFGRGGPSACAIEQLKRSSSEAQTTKRA
jgi:hypothetical protein